MKTQKISAVQIHFLLHFQLDLILLDIVIIHINEFTGDRTVKYTRSSNLE